MRIARQLTLGLLAFGFLATSSFAQSIYWTAASARSQSMGGTYVPSSSDAVDALAANPAGLTALAGRSVDLSLIVVSARGSFSDSVNQGAPLSQTPGALPYGAFGMPIGRSRFSFGVGFVPELLSVAHWRYVDAPGTAGATYGLQYQRSAILAGRAVAGLGVNLGKKLSLGFTVGADYNSNTLDAPYIFQSQPVLKGLKTLLDLHTAGYGWNGSVGALLRPTRKVQLGFAWKSRTLIESYGSASGNASAQFAALGLTAPSTFQYSAKVQNVLPQSALGSVNWWLGSRWLVGLQADWVNWKGAFVTLPVTLTNGTNAAINGLVNSTSVLDRVPVDWKDAYSYHVGAERLLTENTSIRFGYSHANNPVPSSTLTPLTAAIMSNQVAVGFVYARRRSNLEGAYAFDPTARAHVQQSGLLAGEYDNSAIHVGTQTLTLNYCFRF